MSLMQESYEFKSNVAYIVNTRSLPVLKIVEIKWNAVFYMHRYAQQFFMADYLQHGKNSWPERHNWGISLEQICSALSEVKRKPEIWSLRNTTGSDLM